MNGKEYIDLINKNLVRTDVLISYYLDALLERKSMSFIEENVQALAALLTASTTYSEKVLKEIASWVRDNPTGETDEKLDDNVS